MLRFRIHALMQALESRSRPGVIDLTPGIRSLQIHFQPETLTLDALLSWVSVEWAAVCVSDDLQVPTGWYIYRCRGTTRPAARLSINT